MTPTTEVVTLLATPEILNMVTTLSLRTPTLVRETIVVMGRKQGGPLQAPLPTKEILGMIAAAITCTNMKSACDADSAIVMKVTAQQVAMASRAAPKKTTATHQAATSSQPR